MQLVDQISNGETLSLILRIDSGSASGTTCRAALKRLLPTGEIPIGTPESAVLTTAYAADVDDGKPGWTLTLAAATTENLQPGRYALDARITFSDGSVLITDPVQIIVGQAVTGVAP